MRGLPRHTRSDNGPEFIAQTRRRWLNQLGAGTLYIEPGRPWQNGYSENLHGRFHDEVLAIETSRAPGMRSRSMPRGEMNTTPSGLTAVEVSNPGRVRRRVCGLRLGQAVGSRRALIALVTSAPKPLLPPQRVQAGLGRSTTLAATLPSALSWGMFRLERSISSPGQRSSAPDEVCRMCAREYIGRPREKR